MKEKIALALFCAGLLVSTCFAGTARFSTLVTFTCNGSQFQRSGPCPRGGRPGALVVGSDGNFYGAAQDSAEGSSSPTGGTVFSVTSSGTLTVLHTFAPGPNKNYANGNLPGLLTEGPDGKIYGETLYGGIAGCNGYCGFGLLYRVNEDGSGFQIVHKYCSQTNCTDGEDGGKLVAGNDGTVYGTTYQGGSSNSGTIFKVTPSTGAYNVVANFNISTTGANPSGLVVAADGTFYGSSFGSQGEYLFHYTESTGSLTAVSIAFPELYSGTIFSFGANGNLYGLYGIYGVSGEGVFEVDADGSNLQLFPFYTTQLGAGSPQTMLLASDGNFWVADLNGTTGYGDIITLSPTDGSLIQTLSPFSTTSQVGAYPAELIQAPNGALWGSTYQYGKAAKNHFGDGTVFSLNAGLPPTR